MPLYISIEGNSREPKSYGICLVMLSAETKMKKSIIDQIVRPLYCII